MNLCGQLFFWILKIKDPFWGKKAKTYRIVALKHFLCETILTHIQKRYEAVDLEYGAFLKILKIYPFVIKKLKPRFFSFGVSAITLFIINLLINVTYFCNRLLDARIYWRIKQSHQAFFCLLNPKKSKKSKITIFYTRFI